MRELGEKAVERGRNDLRETPVRRPFDAGELVKNVVGVPAQPVSFERQSFLVSPVQFVAILPSQLLVFATRQQLVELADGAGRGGANLDPTRQAGFIRRLARAHDFLPVR